MNNELTLVVMAAGMGSRFGGLKQIEPVGPNGEFILDYSIYDAIETGFNKVVFVIKEENYELFKSTIGARIEKKIKVEYAFQDLNDVPVGFNIPEGRVKPWGTAHAIYAARKFINGPFGIINADDFYGRDAFKVLADFFKNRNITDKFQYALVSYEVGNTITENGSVKRGLIYTDESNNVIKTLECVVEKNDSGVIVADEVEGPQHLELEFDNPVNMNLMGCDETFMNFLIKEIPNFFNNMLDPLKSEFFLPKVLLDTYRSGYADVKMLRTKSKWFGITYKEDLPELKDGINKLIENGEYKKDLWS